MSGGVHASGMLVKLQRFQRPVCHVGGSGFLLVKPADRWESVSPGRVPPFTAVVIPSVRHDEASV